MSLHLTSIGYDKKFYSIRPECTINNIQCIAMPEGAITWFVRLAMALVVGNNWTYLPTTTVMIYLKMNSDIIPLLLLLSNRGRNVSGIKITFVTFTCPIHPEQEFNGISLQIGTLLLVVFTLFGPSKL